jgi:maltose alpha-D-glucosyltransferase/alpha-amylase
MKRSPRSPATTLDDDPLWYKDAIIYELHVKAFFDSNDDGMGDFPGLTRKLDYLQDLGVNTLWLLPFYPSPQRDDGYDIADYSGVHPTYGSLSDARAFIREAHRRGLRVITELVINHTSDQHPWFQAARQAPVGSPKRDFYVWSDSDKKFPETRIIFTDSESSNWAWDQTAQAYYWHRFFSHQPDLNHNNPRVVKAILKVMRFWLDMGVDGLRLDAVPYLCVREGTSNENLPETHAVIKEMRRVVDAHYRDRMFLAEANQWPEDVRDYFGDGDECHVAYHFPLMPRMYMAVALEDRHPILEIMRQTPDIPESCQWAVFLRNHDELTLEMVTSKERDYMYQTYATDPRMRVNVGIRRRLAPLLDNNRDKIQLLNSLLLSMPGTPIIYYGDEIGMGDNIFLGDRNGVRTPMQWSPDRNAGFSRADPARLFLPPLMDPVYGYEAINVEAQNSNPSSLLNWMKRLIAVRKAHPAFGRGTLEFLHPGNRKILAFLREHGEDSILCVANLSRTAQPVELSLGRFKGRVPVEMLGRSPFPPIGELPYLLTLPGHGFYWFLLTTDSAIPTWHEEHLAPEDLPVLVMFDGWRSFFPEQVADARRALAQKIRTQLEQEVVPHFMSAQRWFAAKTEGIETAALLDHAEWGQGKASWMVALFGVEGAQGGTHTYFLPLSLAWEDGDEARLHALLPCTLTRVRQRERTGIVSDAFADDSFCLALVDAMAEGKELRCAGGRLRFTTTAAFAALAGDGVGDLPVRQPTSQGSNTAVALNDRLFLKAYRHLREGINPELEIGRFLTEVARFPHSVPVAGAVEYERDDGTYMVLAILQGYVENQGDGWSYTLGYLERFLEDCRAGVCETLLTPEEVHGPYLHVVRILGQRTGELHAALALPTGDAAFDPEPIGRKELSQWAKGVRAEATATLDLLKHRLKSLPEEVRDEAETLLAARQPLLDRIAAIAGTGAQGLKTRYHGDYHLGQVVMKENDFVIIDFEGEPARSLEERRRKHSPLRDVAGMLRSFNYATYAAVRPLTALQPHDYAGLEGHARVWEQHAAAAFLEGYGAAVAGSGIAPGETAQTLALIDLFTLEKALYEVRYELDHRPDWVSIPIKGILTLLSLTSAPPAQDRHP